MGLKIDPFSFPDPDRDPDPTPSDESATPGQHSIVLGGGCFWCTEALYRQLEGVLSVRPGYAGDTQARADYKIVSSGRTNHAEVIEVVYDPAKLALGQILKIFFSIAHDPTQKDRQGNDVGRQYRSVIFTRTQRSARRRRRYIAQLGRAAVFDAPIGDRSQPLGGILRSRGLPPRLRRTKSRSALHPRRVRSKSRQAEETARRHAQRR